MIYEEKSTSAALRPGVHYKHDTNVVDIERTRDLSHECILLAYKRFGPKWGVQQVAKLRRLQNEVEKMMELKLSAEVCRKRYKEEIVEEHKRIDRKRQTSIMMWSCLAEERVRRRYRARLSRVFIVTL